MRNFVLFLILPVSLGVLLASWVTGMVTQALLGLQAFLALTGLALLLGCQPYRSAQLSVSIGTKTFGRKALPQLPVYSRLPFWKYLFCLFMVQGAFFFLSLIFFDTLEFLTQANPRLQPLEVGSFLEIMPYHKLVVHGVPWILYAVVGVGMAYFTTERGLPPLLAEMIVSDCPRKPKLFIRNALTVMVDLIRCVSLMSLMALAIVWQCQALNCIFQLPPLTETPFRTLFILILIFFVFRKSKEKSLEFLESKKVPLGGMMVFFALIAAFLTFWLHSTGAWFSLGIEATNREQVMRSILAGSFSLEAWENRWCLLMWGWWGVWLPWMSSLIARLSMGRRVWQVLFFSLLFPLLCFPLFFNLRSEQWAVLHANLMQPLFAVGVAGYVLLFIMAFFGHVRSVKDIARGGLIHFGRWRGVLLSKWLFFLLTVTTFYLTGLCMLGWLPVQMLNTLSGIFMTIVAVGFIWALYVGRVPFWGVTKYKALELESP